MPDWKRQTKVRQLSLLGTEETYPSPLDSWLTWRKQLSEKKRWDILENFTHKPYRDLTRYDVVSAFNRKAGKIQRECAQCDDVLRISVNGSEMWCLCHLVEYFSKKIIDMNRYRIAFERTGFSSFNALGASGAKNPTLDMALSQSKSFSSNPERWLVLTGPKGVGKTHLLRAIATNFGPMALYIRAVDMIQAIMSSLGEGGDLEETLSIFKYAPVLLIDDLGTEYRKDFATSQFFSIIDFRYSIDDGKEYPTAITTMKTIDEIVDAWEYIGDRITDKKFSIVGIKAESYRQSERRNQDAG